MAAPRYCVTLTPEERKQLTALTRAATKTTGKRFLYARALLLCDRGADGPGWSVARVSQALGVPARTLERLKQRFVEQGLEAALERKPRATAAQGRLRCGLAGTLETRYRQAERVLLVMDNLNTHGIESL